VVVGLLCVAGCANYHNSGPEAWWHETIGGKISEQRPPPPGDKDPFPNLATVPPKPPPIDTASWNRTTAGLITDRINARQAAAVAPIPTAAASTPAPALEPAGGQNAAAGASLVGATPPPTATGTQAAPSSGASVSTATRAIGGPDVGSSGGVAPVSGQPPQAAAAAPTTSAPFSSAAAAQRVANGQLPPLPTQEPARPAIAPGSPPPAMPLTATPPMPDTGHIGGTDVDFDSNSARLNDPALADVRELASIRGDHGIAITGYGDALTSDPLGQSAAVALGLSRAQALATALVAQGVPYAMLRLNAEAAGRGASLRLLQ
jgi:outer membrane protein OmpA-like peptidoglycan-associated protein